MEKNDNRRQKLRLRDGRTLAYYVFDSSSRQHRRQDQEDQQLPSLVKSQRSKRFSTMKKRGISSTSSSVSSSPSILSADDIEGTSSLPSPSPSSSQHLRKQRPHFIFAFHAMFMTGMAFMPSPSVNLSDQASIASIDSAGNNNGNGYIVVSVDRPGYSGSSSVNVRKYSYEDFADDIKQLADHLDIEKFSVVGHSSGGPNALACAYYMPDRVTSVAILAGDPEYNGQNTPHPIPSPGPVFEFCMGTLLPVLMWPVTPFYKVSNGLQNDFKLERRPYPFRTEDVQQPTMCVLGQDDTLLKRDVAIWVHNRLPNSTLQELPGHGHMDLIKTDVLESVFQNMVQISSVQQPIERNEMLVKCLESF
jgi:alpha/beta hydrolase fold